MGVHTIHGNSMSAMYCSTTDWAFGPVFHNDDDHDSEERVELFLKWLNADPRSLDDKDLERKYSEFRAVEEKLWEEVEQGTL